MLQPGTLDALFETPPSFVVLPVYLIAFGLVTIAGGAVGFVKAKSRASLIAGSIAGVLLALAGWRVRSGPGPGAMRGGIYLGLVTSAVLLARFGVAFKKTHKVMPAGVITLLAVGGVALTIAALVQWQG